MSDKHIDKISGVSTTGHEWDGIRELNNPMPRWWVWTFYATIFWGLAYTIVYPAWPLLTSSTKGLFGYSSRAEVVQDIAAADAVRGSYVEVIKGKTINEILNDETLRSIAVSAGGAAFKVNCVQCHGSGAQGSSGYPNLNDDDWLWGGKPDAIQQTINHGIRFAGDSQTRDSVMPAFADVLDRKQIQEVSSYVASLTGTVADQSNIAHGAVIFADNCAACHGDVGQGMPDTGGPSLNDQVWLYQGTLAAIKAQVERPRHGVMPAWGTRLGDSAVKQLAVYVHGLGGGL